MNDFEKWVIGTNITRHYFRRKNGC